MKNIQLQSRMEYALNHRLKSKVTSSQVTKEAETEVLRDSKGNEHTVVIQAAVESKIYTEPGKALCNINRTIDRMNEIDMDSEEFVIGTYLMNQYNILPEFAVFLRPAKIVPPSMKGSKVLDLLQKADKLDESGIGHIDTPNEFETDQLTLLQAFNPKCSRLVGATPVVRDVLDLTDTIIGEYPVQINGKFYAMKKADHFQQFVLNHKFMKDSAYIYDVEDEIDVKDKAEAWVRLLGARATDKEAFTTTVAGSKITKVEEATPTTA